MPSVVLPGRVLWYSFHCGRVCRDHSLLTRVWSHCQLVCVVRASYVHAQIPHQHAVTRMCCADKGDFFLKWELVSNSRDTNDYTTEHFGSESLLQLLD